MFKNPRSLHRSVVPIAALPLIVTACSGVIFSVLEQRGLEAEWLLKIHTGRYGPINLSPYYAYILGICVLILVISGGLMWWRRRPAPKAGV